MGGPNMDPGHIMQIGMGFMASKTLLTAVEMGLFTELGGAPMTRDAIAEKLGIVTHADDFLGALVSLGLLAKEGSGDSATFGNTEETGFFLDKSKPTYIGGIFEMSSDRLYRYWDNIGEGLKTAKPQNEIKETGKALFEELYSDEARLEQFMAAMSGVQMGSFMALVEKFDFSQRKTVLDVGGASGAFSMVLARRHEHVKCLSFDLPAVAPIAKRGIEAAGLMDRIEVVSGDFFTDPLPKADIVTMGNILHDWNEERKLGLMRAAYDALPEGGALIAVENVIDDERRENTFGMLLSLNMLIEFGDAFDYTGAMFAGWAEKVGFSRTEILPLAGPTSAAIAYK